MRVTSKGQVTIPKAIRQKMGIAPNSEVEFVEERGRVYLRKVSDTERRKVDFSHLVGSASVKMSTDEILRLTRGDE
jgi:AbrB family looped-hinge helix DNA binding protein